jgi:hypothetical protein
MLSQDLAVAHKPGRPASTGDAGDPHLPLELLELELSLEGFEGGEEGFREAVRRAAAEAGGEFLFDLPAAGIVADCKRLAVLRIPAEDHQTMRVVVAVLDDERAEIHLHEPDETTEHLVRFADAFVDVLERLPEPPRDS